MSEPESPSQKGSGSQSAETTPGREESRFSGPVVAIGASAGGLDALERFFDRMPGDSGACFIVIQHLSPDHKSMMSRLLARHTDISTSEVTDRDPLRADHIYLIPPAAMMHLEGDQLCLTPKATRGLNLPIDRFFHSLAENLGNRAIAVILSGTGSDGTRGVVSINDAGGFLLAQSPETAKFDSMPKNAIATGLVDAILPPDHMAQRLMELLHRPWHDVDGGQTESTDTQSTLQQVLQTLEETAQIDFSEYKDATVNRRIERRMQVRQIGDMIEYQSLLADDDDESRALRRELLIGVTRFFRDGEAFQQLDRQVIQPLVRSTRSDETIRVWSAGVSTGEEVYSLAMLFLEAFEKLRRWPTLKIFATDVNQHHLDIASQGQYPESATAELSSDRVEHFLNRVNDNFQVKKELRQSIVFARHNLLTDPPFTQMDLVVCRNTLIYFKNTAQARALKSLQYALRQDGYLFLGSSESLATEQQAFRTLDSKHKLFQLIEASSKRSSATAFRQSATIEREVSRQNFQTAGTPSGGRPAAIRRGQEVLISQYAPPSILVNEQQELCHVFGNVQDLLQIREGWASLSLSRILPDRLVAVATALTHKCLRDREPISSGQLAVPLPGNTRMVCAVSASPVVEKNVTHYVLLSFETRDVTAAASESPAPLDVDRENQHRVDLLERELTATQESLQATIEELETANEELQATNEELMASNEELQSSNEELQSVNEELSTVNAESEERIQLLNQLNADLDNMAKASGVATVFVDADLLLTRFSPDATRIFSIRHSDLGRRLDDFSHQLHYHTLSNDLQYTLGTGVMVEKEVESRAGVIYLLRILPYETDQNTKGAVATFVDITAFRNAERLQTILDGVPEHIAVLNTDGSIALVNEAWRQYAHDNGDPELKRSGPGANYLAALTAESQDDASQQTLLGIQDVIAGKRQFYREQYSCHTGDQQRWFLMTVSPLRGFGYGAVVSHVDITTLIHQQPPDASAV